jgi:alpha-tubulin suppressor-like RCC1 family protein
MPESYKRAMEFGRPAVIGAAWAAISLLSLPSACRAPTQIKVLVRSNLSCAEASDVAINVGSAPRAVEDTLSKGYNTLALASTCDDRSGTADFGSVYLAPGQDTGAIVLRGTLKGQSPARCTKESGFANCIVARRRFSYVDHTTLTMTITLERACLNVPCAADSTCQGGRCVSSVVECSANACDPNPDASAPEDDPKDAGSPPDAGKPRLPVVLLSAHSGTTCATFGDGSLKCWGDNTHGQLGVGDRVARGVRPGDMAERLTRVEVGDGRRVKRVAVGGSHACALLDDGHVKCWGDNQRGQLGLGDTNERTSPAEQAVVLKEPATALSCGRNHTCVVLLSGAVQCWGDNTLGKLGLGMSNAFFGGNEEDMQRIALVDLAEKASAVRAGDTHSCALLTDGRLKCWGANGNAQLGLGDTLSRGIDPAGMGTKLPSPRLNATGVGDTRTVVTGPFSTCAQSTAGAVQCWGGNAQGQLGLGDIKDRGAESSHMGQFLPQVNLGPQESAQSLSATSLHACAVLQSGGVKCWGFNALGQLGQGDSQLRGDTAASMANLRAIDLGTDTGPVKELATGSVHACALFESGRVKCWGGNAEGALGLGDTQGRGDAPEQMGDALPFVDL